MLTNLSTRLKSKINEAISGEDTGIFIVKCVLNNPTTGYKYTPRWVSAIMLAQDFVHNYMDKMQITIAITASELKELLANIQDLECTVIASPLNKTTGDINYALEEIVWEMMVFMENQPDFEKIFSAAAFGNPETGQTELPEQQEVIGDFNLTLISRTMHDIRQVGVNAILKDVTMNDVLHWVCQQFNFENVEIVEPDNTLTYESVIIPPMKYINDIFPFLQERYGIYSKELGYYFTNETMYIYPLFDTDSNTSPVTGTLQLINVPAREFVGLDVYHTTVDNDIIIASNTETKATPLNTRGAENIATAYMSVNADQFLDQDVTIDSTGKVQKTNNITILQLQNSAGNISSTMQNVKYSGQRTNIYAASSSLASYNGTELILGWRHARPQLAQPGHSVIYHFDGTAGEYKTQNGRLMTISYVTAPIASDNLVPWLVFNASLSVFLSPDQESSESVQFRDQ